MRNSASAAVDAPVGNSRLVVVTSDQSPHCTYLFKNTHTHTSDHFPVDYYLVRKRQHRRHRRFAK